MHQDNPKLKLLIVDDEPDNLDLLYRTFRRDFEVFRADHALAALDILDRQGEMAVIISDQRMPDMLGTAFLSRTVPRFPNTIRIVLTGHTDVEDLVEAINTGKVFKYITKPWKPEELKATIAQAADTYRVLRQRTEALQRALRRESSFNAMTTAIRSSLNYQDMLQTIVETLGQTVNARHCLLHLLEGEPAWLSGSLAYSTQALPLAHPGCDPEDPAITQHRQTRMEQDWQSEPVQAVWQALRTGLILHPHQGQASATRLAIPLTYQKDIVAILSLHACEPETPWLAEEISLIEDVAEQIALAISQAKLHEKNQQQSQQIRSELEIARQIQTNLLGRSLLQLDHLKVQAYCHPAHEVGGDFFEVYAHPQGDLWLAVGDVSGKGVPAALFMASTISILRRELAQEVSPEPIQVMQNLNQSLLNDLVNSNCFITLVLARYTPATQQLTYANAGHVYPLVWFRSESMAAASSTRSAHLSERGPCSPGLATLPELPQQKPVYLEPRGVPLGILPTWTAPIGSITLTAGSVLVLISDGITEAIVHPTKEVSPQTGTMLRATGLWQLLQQTGHPDSTSLDLQQLLTEIQAHTLRQDDDQTILSLEVF